MNCLVCDCKLPKNWSEKFCSIGCLSIEEMCAEFDD
jgi:hypothetical protein